MVVAANTLTSLHSGHIIKGNLLTSSIGMSRSTAVARGAASTTASGLASLAVLVRRGRAKNDDEACDMTLMHRSARRGSTLVEDVTLSSPAVMRIELGKGGAASGAQ